MLKSSLLLPTSIFLLFQSFQIHLQNSVASTCIFSQNMFHAFFILLLFFPTVWFNLHFPFFTIRFRQLSYMFYHFCISVLYLPAFFHIFPHFFTCLPQIPHKKVPVATPFSPWKPPRLISPRPRKGIARRRTMRRWRMRALARWVDRFLLKVNSTI